MDHEPFTEWSALYAVGALDSDERASFESHLAVGCAACERNLRQLSSAATALAWTVPPVSVRPELRARVLNRITSGARLVPPAAGRPVRRAWLWAVGGLAAAGLVLALGWGMYDARVALERQRDAASRFEAENSRIAADLARQGQALTQERELTSLLAGKDTRVATLAGVGGADRAEGWLVWSPAKRRGFVVVHYLAELPAGRVYQLWVVANGRPSSGGLFTVDSVGHAAVVIDVVAERPELFAITSEPAGGGPAPTGPFVMKSTT